METATELVYQPSSNGASGERLRIRCVGPRPEWLALPDAVRALEGVELEQETGDRRPSRWRRGSLSANGAAPQVCHVSRSELTLLPVLRQELPGATLVLDLSEEEGSGLGWREARRAGKADLILVGSVRELRELRRRYPALAPRSSLFRRPVDLRAFAPEPLLRRSRALQVRKLRSAHGLTGRLVLFAGPYTEEGGLRLVIEAVREMQGLNPDVRLASVPEGRVDERFLEICRERAAAISSAPLLRSAAEGDERSFWYTSADVVCLPCREPTGALPAKLAAAAGKPFVGSEVEPLLEHVEDGETGFLLSDVETLSAALEALIGDDQEARRLGAAGRRRAEREFSPASAAKRLVGLWSDAR